MILKNNRNHSALSIFKILKASFNYYLYQNNRKSKQYDFSVKGNTVWVFSDTHEKIHFTILVGDKINVTSLTTDNLLILDFNSFLYSQLDLKSIINI